MLPGITDVTNMNEFPNVKNLSETHKIERDVFNSLDGIHRTVAENLIKSGAWVICDA